ncbi:dual specificity calcium/calmodulin-dependent 3',5'-cyclic nucleotide phosphodiesterase 1A-like isoform X2 [Lethenteron reissneri]|uniref:dual specificity calcium/calmodulin-dependent 3',5'-cyclic nucleotide phosphodiesterase 1A-like isoform X2 n=1 Tax=Lethenteron reissneri TaxID=7753 RepID=UPI002AB6D1FF|nr:dual specificity calcium/calmodulin-dependent 3',5'-cyclic nucleotide phosphodiesterase 1A-like isoform X2 [Lethenteron reissneri]
MTERCEKQEKLFKRKSATFTVGGCSYIIVASEPVDGALKRQVRRTQSQSCLRRPSLAGDSDCAGGRGVSGPGGPGASDADPAAVLAEDLPAVHCGSASVEGASLRRKHKNAAQRLRCLVKQLEKGELPVAELRRNIEYAASVLEALYIDETRRLLDSEDELGDISSEAVPAEVRDWLASTFTRRMGVTARRPEDKPRFRSIVHAVQAGIFVERMYRRTSNMVGLSYPPNVLVALKDVNKWSFDVFVLNEASGEHALKFVMHELLTRYELISRYKIPVAALVSFVEALEAGYSKHKNPYHNLAHAADVTQTVHYLLLQSGLMHWLSELETLAVIFAAAIHDLEHTGTTNNFHIQTRSDVALLYNDRAVLENHHVSAAYRLMQDDDMNIFINLSKDDWRELRALVVEMVLATDMSCHFQQIKTMKSALQQPESIDKSKAMSLLLHAGDISHPTKEWPLHQRWTEALMEEFFRQGDREAKLGLPFSPLCDRNSTMVAQSQIGFMDFIVEPTFSVLTDMAEKVVVPLAEEAARAGTPGVPRRGSAATVEWHRGKRAASDGSVTSICTVDLLQFRALWQNCLSSNKERWKEQAAAAAATALTATPTGDDKEAPMQEEETTAVPAHELRREPDDGRRQSTAALEQIASADHADDDADDVSHGSMGDQDEDHSVGGDDDHNDGGNDDDDEAAENTGEDPGERLADEDAGWREGGHAGRANDVEVTASSDVSLQSEPSLTSEESVLSDSKDKEDSTMLETGEASVRTGVEENVLLDH